MRQRTLTGFIITCAAIVLMSCNASASAGAPQHSNATSSVTATAAPIPTYTIGQAASVGNSWTITLTSATVADSSAATPPTAGNVYLIVALTFKNISNQAQTLSTAYSLALTDSNNEQYDQAVVANLSKVPDGDIPAGSQVTGQLVYTVPQAQHAYTLTFQNNAALQGAVSWNITS